jgi:hypothetical protein
MQKSKHSKFKNTGILFELLTRQLTAEILSGKQDSRAKELLFKFFKESCELGKEWQLYNFIVNEQFLDDKKASRALDVVLSARSKLNNRVLTVEKYELIKEIKEAYPIDTFLKSSIKNYKVYASAYKVFENHVSKSNFNVDEIIQAKDFLIENLVKLKTAAISSDSDDVLIEDYKKQSEDVRLLAYKFLVENMNSKYDTMNSPQKNILREYINNVSNTNSISSFVDSEKTKLKAELRLISESIDNKITRIKVLEVANQLDTIDVKRGVRDNHVMLLLLSHELLKEITSVSKK